MIFIIILIGFLIFSNMSPRYERHRRPPFYHDYPPTSSYRHDVEYERYFHHPMPYNGQNNEGGYQQFQREQRQQNLYYTLLFLVALVVFLLYHNFPK